MFSVDFTRGMTTYHFTDLLVIVSAHSELPLLRPRLNVWRLGLFPSDHRQRNMWKIEAMINDAVNATLAITRITRSLQMKHVSANVRELQFHRCYLYSSILVKIQKNPWVESSDLVLFHSTLTRSHCFDKCVSQRLTTLRTPQKQIPIIALKH